MKDTARLKAVAIWQVDFSERLRQHIEIINKFDAKTASLLKFARNFGEKPGELPRITVARMVDVLHEKQAEMGWRAILNGEGEFIKRARIVIAEVALSSYRFYGYSQDKESQDEVNYFKELITTVPS